MDLVDTETDAVIQLSELRLVPASVLASRLAVLETAASAHRAELLKRPSHCHTAPPRQGASTGQAIGPPTLPDELWHAIFLAERQRWRRLRMCMVCNAWLRAIRDDPETWRALVLTHDRRAVLDLPTANDRRGPDRRGLFASTLCDDFVGRMVHDGALPILATHVRRLVPDLSWVTTVVLEGQTLPEFPRRAMTSGTLERRHFEVAWPVLSALCELSFPSLRKLAIDVAVLTCHSCDTARFEAVFRWLRDDLPAELEFLMLHEMKLVDTRLAPWEQTHHQRMLDRYVHLKGLRFFCYELEGAQMQALKGSHAVARRAFEVLRWSYFFECNDEELKMLASLENLQSLKLTMSAPTPGDLAKLCKAMPARVKVLYLVWDSSAPISIVDWGVLGVLKGLVELCVCLDSCEFAQGIGPAAITSYLAQLLPKTTILIAEWLEGGGKNGPNPNEIWCPPDILDREFLPLCVPDWHRLPGAYQPRVGS